ncbi:hypothetical protein HRbin06_00154 [archaeon HR06]|nr:hypothetical protein HRbin06_00154 [archaeon HR06]
MSEEIPLSPIGREQIHKLETALLVGSLFREEVMNLLKSPKERLTWVDSLAVAAAALAREKAKMSIPKIAEELGRTEATIRNHLSGKTEAGRIVLETYEKFAKEGLRLGYLEKVMEEKDRKLEELKIKIKKIIEELNELLIKL